MSAINPVGDVAPDSPNEIDGNIRESLRRHGTSKPASVDRQAVAQPEAKDLHLLIESVSGATISEIDHLISELQKIRLLLQSEGERVRGEITRYTGLSQSAVATMKMVADRLQSRHYEPTSAK